MRTVAAVFAMFLAACNSSPTDPGGSLPLQNATVVVPHGASNQLNADLRIAFAQLLEDSRCPSSVVCVWQGNGAIRLDVTTPRGAQSATLNTAGGPAFPREATLDGYTFTLVELDPQRQTPDPIAPGQYRATISVRPAARP